MGSVLPDINRRGGAAFLPLRVDGEIGGANYDFDLKGLTVHGVVRFHRLAPYVGIGWGNAFGKEGRWGILSNFGVVFLGRPNVSLLATGSMASNTTFMGDLAEEEKDVEDDLSILRFYPVFSISLFYRF